jgi:RNA polymerase sigma-70 factor (ECF subfamily)
MGDDHSAELLARLEAGDSRAAGELYDNYLDRLIRLVRSRYSNELNRRFDPEDVVQSALCSFFLRAQKGLFVHRRSGDLWRLLAQITCRKLYKRIEFHRQELRDYRKERHASGEDEEQLATPLEPSWEEAMEIMSELQHVLDGLEPHQRLMLGMRLQDHTFDEIAAATGRTQRTVRRLIDKVRAQLEKRVGANPER